LEKLKTSRIRVAIFIDGSNLFRASLAQSFKIDLEKLVSELTGGRTLFRPCYYGSIPEDSDKKQVNFHRKLKYLGFKVVIKTLKKGYNKSGKEMFIEKGVDVALVTEMLSMAYKNAYDVAILVSGDNDYVDAVEEVKSIGKRVEIAFFEKIPNTSQSFISPEFKMSGDQFISLDTIKHKIALN
jgi:uncharacterized LabA/DUF88 family protein